MEDTAAPRPWYKKQRYHHGNLRESALRLGRELAATGGPEAITLRGIARALGVTPAALVYYFGCVADLRAAVAESVLEELEDAAGVALGHPETGPRHPPTRVPREIGERWIHFAATNPHLYRLVSGEIWHERDGRTNGRHGIFAVPSPRLALENAFLRKTRRYGKPKGEPELARHLAMSIHGLALARLDGVPEDAVLRGLDRAVAAVA